MDETPFVDEEKVDTSDREVAHWEKELMRLLISFGDQQIALETVNENKEKVTQQITIAQYIIVSIQNDAIQFDNAVYQEIVDYYVNQLNDGNIPSHNDFTQHENQQINQFAIDVFSSQYELSPNWINHGVYPVTEEQQLNKGVINTVYAFKLSKLTQAILENQEQLKTVTDA